MPFPSAPAPARTTPATAGRRATCARCGLPASTCLCALVVPIDNRVDVLVLQHPLEAREAKGSIRLLARCLARCRVVVGETFEDSALQAMLHGEGRRSALLYPASDTVPALPGAGVDGIDQLVVLDGTWRKSLRLLKRHPLLEALPRLSVTPAMPTSYGALRKAPRPGALSSLEATCAALAQCERDAERYQPLLDAFDEFVATSLARVGTRDRRRP